jgi:hypothetical protein
MRLLNAIRFLIFTILPFVPFAAFAQSPEFDSETLPILLTQPQFDSLTNLTPGPYAIAIKKAAQPRRIAPVIPPLTTQQLEYREAVRALGKDEHHFVHVELTSGKALTGAIVGIDDGGFQLRDGIIHENRIAYSQLRADPRHVPAVGTHIGNGMKWAGFGTDIVIVAILAIPAFIAALPFLASGAFQD